MSTIIRRRTLLERSITQGHRSALPYWVECLIGVVRKATDAPKRIFRTCAMPRCTRVFYGTSELCRECRITVRDKAK